MKTLLALLVSVTSLPAFACDSALLDQNFRRLASTQEVNLCEAYSGKVVLVVNTASKCGNTPQYDGLEKLYEQYGEEGLVVLGFPSNDFMGQEPGTEENIEEFCRLTYGVEFPMFEKTSVKKDNADPFYAALCRVCRHLPHMEFSQVPDRPRW